ncbi:hypothetical protein PMIN06_001015 [Paraphaeosphaeria minitans]
MLRNLLTNAPRFRDCYFSSLARNSVFLTSPRFRGASRTARCLNVSSALPRERMSGIACGWKISTSVFSQKASERRLTDRE